MEISSCLCAPECEHGCVSPPFASVCLCAVSVSGYHCYVHVPDELSWMLGSGPGNILVGGRLLCICGEA